MTAQPLIQLVRFTLVRDRPSAFHFFHGPALYAFILDRLGNPTAFPGGVHLHPAETGRVFFEAGQPYHFGVAFRPDAVTPLAAFPRLLESDPRTRFGNLQATPFGSGLELEAVHDALTGEQVRTPVPRARWLTTTDLARCAANLEGLRALEIRFDTPVLIWHHVESRRDAVFDGDHFDGATFLDRVASAIERAAPYLLPQTPRPPVQVERNAMFPADVRYGNGKQLRGAVGALALTFEEGLPLDWARALLYAGVIGVGQAANMGQGRFHVAGAELTPHWPPAPAATLLSLAARPARFEDAAYGLRGGSPMPGVDGVDAKAFLSTLTERAPDLADRLGSGGWSPKALRGVLLERRDGALRGLAVPTVEDRFAQRACLSLLAPAVDGLLDDAAFGYRQGLSRNNAERSLRLARDEGYTHVLDADLRAFFDEVDWTVLQARLDSLLRGDPIVRLLMAFVQAPVEFAGERIQPTRGLPQGAPVSPLLANLYLDAFDRDMRARGFRLVRYADDFVIACRSAAEVERAREAATASLARLKLALADEKTQVSDFDAGFRFLGFLFCRSIVLDSPNRARIVGKVDEDLWAEAHELRPGDARGWVHRWLELRGVAPEGTAPDPDGDEAEDGESRWRRPFRRPTAAQRPVIVTRPDLRLTGSRKGLFLWDKDHLLQSIAWEHISEVVLFGAWRVSAGVFQHAMQRRVPVALYRADGTPAGLVLPDKVRSPSQTALAQWAWAQGPRERLNVARGLIEAKIHNLRLLARHQPGDNDELRELLKDLARATRRADSVDRLRGLEGRAAHVWFSAWPNWLEERFSFPGRTGRGATDAINAVLNLLYTQLFRLSWLAAITAGLDPYLGVLHDGKGRYAALAADLQEPFRFLADRLVLELVHRERLTRDDFVFHEKMNPPVRLNAASLRAVLQEWEGRLASEVMFAGRKQTYRQHILDQAERLASVVEGDLGDLHPFRLKW